jgi:hypothetical protein
MLNRFRRLPEPAKRHLRVGFVWVVELGGRLPGAPGAATRARRVLPGPYQWFSDRYETYREQHYRGGPGGQLPIVDTKQMEFNGFWVNPPDDLTTDERACFTRLVSAANVRRKRILW